jgi:hypothetical protein
MKLTDLTANFDTSCSLGDMEWACAVLLGDARVISNEKHRSDEANRGKEGNRAVDLDGSLGEFLLLRMVRKLPQSETAQAYMRNHIFIPGGGRDAVGPDLLFEEDGQPTGIDVETFDCAKNKHFFAINNKKHTKLAGQCVGYMGLICSPYGRRAYITKLIPYDHVSTWPVDLLKKNDEGSASRNFPIEDAMGLYCSEEYSLEESRRDTYRKEHILALARQHGPGSPCERLSERLLKHAKAFEDVRDSL